MPADVARIEATAAAIRQRVESAQPWPELDALPELAPVEAEPYPFDGLGPLLGQAARAIADGVQAPDSLAAGAVLASAALAVQPHADVLMPHGDTCPTSLFVATSAASGDRKSAADRVAGAAIEQQRRDEANAHAAAKAAAGDEPPPPPRSLIVSKATTEGLHSLLKHQSHVGLFSPEGAELLTGHSLREERRAAGVAWMLKAWSGETLDTLTKGDGLSVLPGRRVSMHLLVQPLVLRQLLNDPLAQGQGWIARCLIAQPRTLAGTRLFKAGTPPAEHPDVQAFHAAIRGLLERKPPTEGSTLALLPRRLTMTTEATALWVSFYDACEVRQGDGRELAAVRPWASKAAEHAARIAGVIALAENFEAGAIDGQTMLGALAVTRFYLTEHVRLLGQSQEQQHLERLHGLLAWIKERRSAEHRDVLQRTPRALRDLKAEGLGKLLDELCQRGYIRRQGDRWEARP